jgi:cobalt-zinc-cadmium efflux system protein
MHQHTPHTAADSSLHAHGHGDAKHAHAYAHHADNQHRLIWALLLTLGFALIEAGTGWFAHSLALISDAGHMVTDAAALGLALLAQIISRRPPSPKHSFGFGRSQSLAALLNALAMLVIIVWINIEAVTRLIHPTTVNAQSVMAVALIGLIINIIVAWMLSRDSENLNMRAAFTHVLGDLLGSVAALAAGIIIHYTGWMQVDPLLSILVTLLIFKSTIRILKEAWHFLMAGVPHHIDYLQIGHDLAAIDGVLSVHDLHVWEMTPGHSALIGHLEIRHLKDWPHILANVKKMLLTQHKIDHITIQAETRTMAHPAHPAPSNAPTSTH